MLALVAFVSATQGIQLAQFPWWEFDFAEMRRDGLLIGYPTPTGHHRPGGTAAYRYEAAIKTNAAATNFMNIGDGWSVWIRDMAMGASEGNPAEYREVALRESQRLPFLVNEFRKELDQLGVNARLLNNDINRLRRTIRTSPTPKIGEALTRFPDVPHGHWADQAVHNLRREGILWGYPNGTFGAKAKR